MSAGKVFEKNLTERVLYKTENEQNLGNAVWALCCVEQVVTRFWHISNSLRKYEWEKVYCRLNGLEKANDEMKIRV